ncbi:MAG: hypothetical protein NTW04_03830 [Elusimicrobia bacterium]|nr:hypothetical protein [Elusimicrobiota bacterium]
MTRVKESSNLESMVTNFDKDRYDMVVLASIWAKHLGRQEEFKLKPNAELIEMALQDVLSGKIAQKQIFETANSAAKEEEKKPATKKKEAKKSEDKA